MPVCLHFDTSAQLLTSLVLQCYYLWQPGRLRPDVFQCKTIPWARLSLSFDTKCQHMSAIPSESSAKVHFCYELLCMTGRIFHLIEGVMCSALMVSQSKVDNTNSFSVRFLIPPEWKSNISDTIFVSLFTGILAEFNNNVQETVLILWQRTLCPN